MTSGQLSLWGGWPRPPHPLRISRGPYCTAPQLPRRATVVIFFVLHLHLSPFFARFARGASNTVGSAVVHTCWRVIVAVGLPLLKAPISPSGRSRAPSAHSMSEPR